MIAWDDHTGRAANGSRSRSEKVRDRRPALPSEDPLAGARGIIAGVVIGIFLWGLIVRLLWALT